MRVIGLDAGSTTTKGVVLEDGKLTAKALRLTAGDPKLAMRTILAELQQTSEDKILTTGYGRKLLENVPNVTEITCHGRGAHFLMPEAQYVIDIGGQDSKVIRISPKGSVLDFAMNDKCAAGTGRFVEVLMSTLGEDIRQLDEFVANATPVKINSMCTVFAESEVVSLVGKGEAKENIALGVLQSILQRIANQFTHVKSQSGEIAFTGGLSQSVVFQELLEKAIQMPVKSHEDAQFAGAIGAAIILQEGIAKGKF